MNILLLEPYLTGSHAAWAQGYARHSRHRVEIMSLPGRHWKWRMHGGGVTLARQFLASALEPDLILASDMLDLTTFLALTRSRTATAPTAIYFHENQLTYPWSPDDGDTGKGRDAHYGFINYAGALAADAVFFNSHYHMRSFLQALPRFLKAFPDANELGTAPAIEKKSSVLPLGMNLRSLDAFRSVDNELPESRVRLLLWNHRWEFDKNPDAFFQALFLLSDEGLPFQLAVVGESFSRTPPIFAEARRRLADRIVHWGYLENFADYARLLWDADILPVTSVHDFFGVSVVEGIYCGCRPLLPHRLAYPEHIPADLHESCLYREGELVGRLREMLTNPCGADAGALRRQVSGYDWETAAPLYDRVLENLAASVGD